MPQKITQKLVDAARAAALRHGKPRYLWDSDLRGFGAYVSPSGRASWLVQKWMGGRGGKAKRVVLGHYPPMLLDEARRSAAIAIGEVSRGIDLVSEKERKRAEKRKELAAPTLGEAVDLFLKRNSTGNRYWHEVQRRLVTQFVSPLGKDRLVTSINRAEIRTLVEAKEDVAPGAARLLFAALRPFFKWCVEREIITTSPCDALSPPKPIKARDRVLTDAEVSAIWRAADQLGWPFGPFYKLLLLTGQRREEVAAMAWSEVDLEQGLWIIPRERAKNGREHIVHLPEPAVAILQTIDRRSPLVFTTTGRTAISGYSKSKLQLDELLRSELQGGFKSWRTHDLRRTMASGIARLGHQPFVIERLLNHVSGSTGGLIGVYQRYDYLGERQKAIKDWAAYVAEITVLPAQSERNQRQFEERSP